MSTSTLLTFSLLFLSVLAGAGTWLYLLYTEKAAGEIPAAFCFPRLAGKPRRAGRGMTLRELWEIEDIKQGVIVLPGGRYRLVCRVSSPDYWLLSDEEQNENEDYVIGALMQLTFPVQVLITSQAVDVKAIVDELRKAELPPVLRDFALQRADFLESIAQEKTGHARQAYLVVPCETQHGFDFARGELFARVALLADALAPARIRIEVLSSDAVVDLLAHLLNRGRTWKPSEAVEAGVMTLYHVSERSVTVHG
ncbi:MAG: hypothetical protein ACPLRH_00175 [Desulfotomaculales bacterium]